MTLPRTRLALPLLSCTLLLTACPGAPPTLNVPSDPAVLHGTWQGELVSATELSEGASGDGQVFLLQREMAPHFLFPGGPSTPPKSSVALLALDATTGAERQRVPLEGALALRFRPAEGGAPAGLLALRRLPSSAAGLALTELDPATLVERKQTLLPAREYGYRFSADGRWLMQGLAAPLDSLTLEPAILPQPLGAELQPPQDTPTRFVLWDFGERFLRVATRTSSAQTAPWTLRYFSAVSGNAFGARALHPAACASTSAAELDSPADMVSLPGGGAALAYRDGTVELREAGDRLRQVVNLGGCRARVLRVDGDVLTFADLQVQGQELGTLRVSDGQVLTRRTLSLPRFLRLVAEGTALVTRSMYGSGPLAALEGVSGQAWALEPKVHTLRLDTRATWQSKTTYTSVGTAVLDGERLNFAATANSVRYELRAQSAPPLPVTWRGELRREDGGLVARVAGNHMTQTPSQTVGLELQGLDRDFAFQGSLKR